MKKLLLQLDPDPIPATFDTVVAYDGGADHVVTYGSIDPDNVHWITDGAIFTRAPKEKRFTAIFVGGSSMAKGEALFKAVKKKFFADFRVSVMLDSNGSNTTAAAGVAVMAKNRSLEGKKAVVLAGTGPVGMRAAVMLAREGATVSLTSRKIERAKASCDQIQERFGLTVTPVQAFSNADRAAALEGAHVCFATGAAAAQLLEKSHWQDHPTLELLADANATPPLGVDGVEMFDKAKERGGKVVWGAIGFGALKLAVHRACIGKLFEANDRVFDAEEIYAVAKEMA
jgi:hypothetical protein